MKRLIFLGILAVFGFYAAWPAYTAYQIHQGLKSGNAAQLSSKIDFEKVRSSLRPTIEREADMTLSDTLAKAGSAGAALAPGLKEKILPGLVERTLTALVTPDVLIRFYRERGSAKDRMKRIVMDEAGKMGGIAGLGGGLGGLLGAAGAKPEGGKAAELGGIGSVGALADKLGGGNGLGGLFGKKPQEAPATPPQPASAAEKSASPEESADKAPPAYGLSNIKGFGFDGPLGLRLGIAKDAAASEPDLTAHMAFTGFDWKLVGLVPRNRQER